MASKTKKVPLGFSGFTEPGEPLHILRGEFLIEASRLFPEMLHDLTNGAEFYRQLFEFSEAHSIFRGGILHPGVGPDCPPRHAPLRDSLIAWSKKWNLDKSREPRDWILKMLWSTFRAWMLGEPRKFHTYWPTWAGLPTQQQRILIDTEWDPLSEEPEKAALARITSDVKKQLVTIRQRVRMKYKPVRHISRDHINWAVRNVIGRQPYEEIASQSHSDVRTVQNAVTKLLKELDLRRPRGRPRKVGRQNSQSTRNVKL